MRGRARLPLKGLTCQLNEEEVRIKGRGSPAFFAGDPLGEGSWARPS